MAGKRRGGRPLKGEEEKSAHWKLEFASWMQGECAGVHAKACPQKSDSRNVALMAAARTSIFPSDRFQTGVLVLAMFVVHYVNTDGIDTPEFGEPIKNVTITVGREATLTCVVENLSTYKVAWLRVDTQTILTIAVHVITKNHRIAVANSDKKTWFLHIREVRESDRGWYMCQINTDPMKSQVGYLEVVVPPDILDYPTSTDMVVREGNNVTLQCAATGFPPPTIVWKREQGEPIPLSNGKEVLSVEGSIFNITRVNRLHMGAYLCIASNRVPPTVSKRIMLIVHFPPMIWIQNQLVGAQEGQSMTLSCHSEAFPKSINYWTRNGETIAQGSSGKYEPVLIDNAYKVHMKLTIKYVTASDYGSYKCVSRNSLGETDGEIKLYHIPKPTTSAKPTTTTTTTTTTEAITTPTVSPEKKPGRSKKQKDKAKERRPGKMDIVNEVVTLTVAPPKNRVEKIVPEEGGRLRAEIAHSRATRFVLFRYLAATILAVAVNQST